MGEELFVDERVWEKYDTKKLLEKLPNYFEPTGDIEKSAYLNWRFDRIRNLENQFYDMGKAYFQTALCLVDACISDNCDKKADIWIFPIMFNTVHGIEVYLKGFNSQIRILEKLEIQERQKTKIEGKHDIKQLCQLAISLIKGSSQKEGLLPEFEFIKKFIDILYANTNDMTFARYPISNKGDLHFYVQNKDNVTIDLEVYKIWVSKVFSILDSCTGFVDFQIDQIKDYLYEMQQEYDEY